MGRILKYWVLSLIIFIGCDYNVEEDLYPLSDCITIDVRYSVEIVDILNRNCYVCHDQIARTGNIVLEGYDNLFPVVQRGQLAGAIQHLAGFSAMPQNAPALPECDINKILSWINDGSPNN